MIKPKRRSKLRVLLGTTYYTFKKYYYWYFSRVNFAKEIKKEYFPIKIFSHKTIMLRKLKDVDMCMQRNKVVNLKIAIGLLNGLVVKPGQTFSFWRQV
ncbi:VanW family protein [Candidatus Pacearchaeota archaeon]|nr:VanW family protein [Candidatus Pacearchaeota archaeon]